jgi:ABC-type antimicrobial peptide transport system permease subunit
MEPKPANDPEVIYSQAVGCLHFSASLHGHRFNVTIVGPFAATVLLLAIIGIYGVMAYTVARRTREIGIRMALGADRGTALNLVLGQAMKTAAVGVLAGIGVSLIFTRLMRSLLYQTSSNDPLTFLAGRIIGCCYSLRRLRPCAAGDQS